MYQPVVGLKPPVTVGTASSWSFRPGSEQAFVVPIKKNNQDEWHNETALVFINTPPTLQSRHSSDQRVMEDLQAKPEEKTWGKWETAAGISHLFDPQVILSLFYFRWKDFVDHLAGELGVNDSAHAKLKNLSQFLAEETIYTDLNAIDARVHQYFPLKIDKLEMDEGKKQLSFYVSVISNGREVGKQYTFNAQDLAQSMISAQREVQSQHHIFAVEDSLPTQMKVRQMIAQTKQSFSDELDISSLRTILDKQKLPLIYQQLWSLIVDDDSIPELIRIKILMGFYDKVLKKNFDENEQKHFESQGFNQFRDILKRSFGGDQILAQDPNCSDLLKDAEIPKSGFFTRLTGEPEDTRKYLKELYNDLIKEQKSSLEMYLILKALYYTVYASVETASVCDYLSAYGEKLEIALNSFERMVIENRQAHSTANDQIEREICGFSSEAAKDMLDFHHSPYAWDKVLNRYKIQVALKNFVLGFEVPKGKGFKISEIRYLESEQSYEISYLLPNKKLEKILIKNSKNLTDYLSQKTELSFNIPLARRVGADSGTSDERINQLLSDKHQTLWLKPAMAELKAQLIKRFDPSEYTLTPSEKNHFFIHVLLASAMHEPDLITPIAEIFRLSIAGQDENQLLTQPGLIAYLSAYQPQGIAKNEIDKRKATLLEKLKISAQPPVAHEYKSLTDPVSILFSKIGTELQSLAQKTEQQKVVSLMFEALSKASMDPVKSLGFIKFAEKLISENKIILSKNLNHEFRELLKKLESQSIERDIIPEYLKKQFFEHLKKLIARHINKQITQDLFKKELLEGLGKLTLSSLDSQLLPQHFKEILPVCLKQLASETGETKIVQELEKDFHQKTAFVLKSDVKQKIKTPVVQSLRVSLSATAPQPSPPIHLQSTDVLANNATAYQHLIDRYKSPSIFSEFDQANKEFGEIKVEMLGTLSTFKIDSSPLKKQLDKFSELISNAHLHKGRFQGELDAAFSLLKTTFDNIQDMSPPQDFLSNPIAARQCAVIKNISYESLKKATEILRQATIKYKENLATLTPRLNAAMQGLSSNQLQAKKNREQHIILNARMMEEQLRDYESKLLGDCYAHHFKITAKLIAHGAYIPADGLAPLSGMWQQKAQRLLTASQLRLSLKRLQKKPNLLNLTQQREAIQRKIDDKKQTYQQLSWFFNPFKKYRLYYEIEDLNKKIKPYLNVIPATGAQAAYNKLSFSNPFHWYSLYKLKDQVGKVSEQERIEYKSDDDLSAAFNKMQFDTQNTQKEKTPESENLLWTASKLREKHARDYISSISDDICLSSCEEAIASFRRSNIVNDGIHITTPMETFFNSYDDACSVKDPLGPLKHTAIHSLMEKIVEPPEEKVNETVQHSVHAQFNRSVASGSSRSILTDEDTIPGKEDHDNDPLLRCSTSSNLFG